MVKLGNQFSQFKIKARRGGRTRTTQERQTTTWPVEKVEERGKLQQLDRTLCRKFGAVFWS